MAIEGGTGKKHRTVKLVQLVGGLEHFLFLHSLGIIIPTGFHNFQRGRYTTNQTSMYKHLNKDDRNMLPELKKNCFSLSNCFFVRRRDA